MSAPFSRPASASSATVWARLGEFGRAVGQTPAADVRAEDRRLRLKLESANPCGSIKDRTALGLLCAYPAEVLARANPLVESTSGNLGVALAHVAEQIGIPFVAVVDPRTSPVLLERIEEHGGRLELVDAPDAAGNHLTARLHRVRALCSRLPRALWPNQYANPANPAIHFATTGPELDAQLGEDGDAVFAAVSTGGTLTGIARYLRGRRPDVRIIAVDAIGSSVFGAPALPRRLTGIGANRPSSFLDDKCYDDVELVGDEDAFATCRSVLEGTGLAVGGSAGAVIAGCLRHLERHPEIEHPICLCADGGENYRRTIFDDDYLRREGLRLPAQPQFSMAERADSRLALGAGI